MALLRKACKQAADVALVHHNLGTAHALMQHGATAERVNKESFAQAEAELGVALSLQPHLAESFVNQGAIQTRKGNTNVAMGSLDAVRSSRTAYATSTCTHLVSVSVATGCPAPPN